MARRPPPPQPPSSSSSRHMETFRSDNREDDIEQVETDGRESRRSSGRKSRLEDRKRKDTSSSLSMSPTTVVPSTKSAGGYSTPSSSSISSSSSSSSSSLSLSSSSSSLSSSLSSSITVPSISSSTSSSSSSSSSPSISSTSSSVVAAVMSDSDPALSIHRDNQLRHERKKYTIIRFNRLDYLLSVHCPAEYRACFSDNVHPDAVRRISELVQQFNRCMETLVKITEAKSLTTIENVVPPPPPPPVSSSPQTYSVPRERTGTFSKSSEPYSSPSSTSATTTTKAAVSTTASATSTMVSSSSLLSKPITLGVTESTLSSSVPPPPPPSSALVFSAPVESLSTIVSEKTPKRSLRHVRKELQELGTIHASCIESAMMDVLNKESYIVRARNKWLEKCFLPRLTEQILLHFPMLKEKEIDLSIHGTSGPSSSSSSSSSTSHSSDHSPYIKVDPFLSLSTLETTLFISRLTSIWSFLDITIGKKRS